MSEVVKKTDELCEYYSHERCWILESWNTEQDSACSIARARVEFGVTTKPHRLKDVVERYLIVEGMGLVTLGNLTPLEVGPGSVVIIPAGVSQQIKNIGSTDLVFYCICTPRFTPDCYEAID